MRVKSSFSLCNAVCALLAISTPIAASAYVPDEGLAMPRYFSGTNCRARGAAYGDPAPPGQGGRVWFETAWLLVGPAGSETLVQDWVNEGHSAAATEVALEAMFDSSHFLNATEINVKIVAVDNRGRIYQAEAATYGQNWARCWNTTEFYQYPGGNGSGVASALLSEMNYFSTDHGGGWSSTDYLVRLSGSVIYTAVHGNVGYHLDGTDEGATISASGPEDSTYSYWRPLHNGTGFPPYNSSGLPPINCLLLESCNCGDDNAFSVALEPHANWYNDTIDENQAVHAYTVEVPIVDFEDRASILLKSLSNGMTILQAKMHLLAVASDEGILCRDEPDDGFRILWLVSDTNIIGDPTMRVKNVYTGTAETSPGWYRSLP